MRSHGIAASTHPKIEFQWYEFLFTVRPTAAPSFGSCALFDDVSSFQREHVRRIGTQPLRLPEIELRAKDEEGAMDMC